MFVEKDKPLGPGYSPIYKTKEWKKEQCKFEIRVGQYAYNDSRSHNAVNKALNRMKNVLWAYYHDQFVALGKKEFFLEAFTKDCESSAGQVGRMVGEGIFEIVGKDVFNSMNENLHSNEEIEYLNNAEKAPNLREKMTAFYNAAYYNASGKSKKDSAKSINFKNIMQKIVTSSSYISNDLIDRLHLDKASVNEAIKYSSKNIFKSGILSGLHNIFKGPDVYSCPVTAFHSKDKDDSYTRSRFRYKYRKQRPYRPFFYQEDIGLNPSYREAAFHGLKFTKALEEAVMNNILEHKNEGIRSPIVSGEIERQITYGILGNAKQLENSQGFRLTASTSGTTTRLLNTLKWLGFQTKDLLDFRLAIMGWMLPERDHSLYEILCGSHAVGIHGSEIMTNATTMDRSIDPLSEDEIREHCGKDCDNKIPIKPGDMYYHKRLLPIEYIYYNRNDLDSKKINLTNNEQSELAAETTDENQLRTNRTLPNILAPYKQAVSTYKSPANILMNHSLVFHNFMPIYKYQYSKSLTQQLTKNIYDKLDDKFKEQFGTGHSFFIYSDLQPELPISPRGTVYDDMKVFSELYTDDINKEFENLKSDVLSIDPLFKQHESTMDLQTIKLYKKIYNLLKNYSYKIAKYIIKDAGLNASGYRMNKLIDDTHITNNMLQDYLTHAPNKYNGHTYSGQRMLPSYYPGGTITTSMFTSTSKDKETAKTYYKGAVLVFDLHNVGVDIADELDQVLIPPGCKFKVKKVTTTPESGDEVSIKGQKKIKYVYLESIENNSYKTSPSKSNISSPFIYNQPRIFPTRFY